MFEHGYFRCGEIHGIPVRFHWTLPVGMLLFGGLSPAFWLAFVVLVLLHEAGHAFLVRRYGFLVTGIDVTGFGGLCRWVGRATDHQRSVIAWGGVGAQAVLLVASIVFVALFGWPASWLGRSLANAFIQTNALIMAINLLPFPPFDGAEAWKLLRRFKGGDRWRFGQH
ncbi:MAG TPA: hypothetical protein VFB62_05400 [Polyangiaceae bacterium]|jgi:Zn-dependent protease|nr:hypothetical protein [Polyangiaceae bacterium]